MAGGRSVRSVIALVALALVVAVLGAPGAEAAAPLPPPNGGYANRIEESFSSDWWWASSRWGLLLRPVNTAVATEANGNRLLTVRFNAGTHNGTSWRLGTGTADDVHIRYRIMYPTNWNPSLAANNVKMPGFGNPLDAAGACLAGCGGMPSNGMTSYSARTDINAANGRPGWYVYHADMPQTIPSYGSGGRWPGRATPLQNGRWYTIDLRIVMNTPGQRDGVLQAWVDGANVYDVRTWNFRTTNALHVGNAWFDFYYGGSGLVPQTTSIAIDDIVVEW